MSHSANPSRTTESTEGGADGPRAATPADPAGETTGDLGGDREPRTMTVEGVSAPATYRFRVSEAVAAPAADGSAEVVNETTVLGSVAAEGDETDFRFSGELVSFRVIEGDVAVTVDGEDVAVPVPDERDLPNTVTLHSEGDVVDYKFCATGRVEKGPLADAATDEVDGRRVRGTLGGQGIDNYFFSGSLVFESANAPVTITIDVNETRDD